jgi:hypothetical protein
VPSLLQNMRETNRRLSFHLDSIAARYEHRIAVTPEQIASLLSALLGTGADIRAQGLPAPGTDKELERELSEYRNYVERLRDLLPSIHHQLVAERARIAAQRSRISAVAQWARVSSQTL